MNSKLGKFKKYRKLIQILKKECPLAFPVTVRRVKLGSDDGDCYKNKKQFFIRVNSGLTEKIAIETLVHEWAHARAWSHLHDAMEFEEFHEKVHDATWGVAYSEVYRIYERFISSPC